MNKSTLKKMFQEFLKEEEAIEAFNDLLLDESDDYSLDDLITDCIEVPTQLIDNAHTWPMAGCVWSWQTLEHRWIDYLHTQTQG